MTTTTAPSQTPEGDATASYAPAGGGLLRWLPAAVIAFGVLLNLYLTRGTWFYLDDWDFMVLRADWSQSALLGPQNLNWVFTTDVLYTILGAIFGVASYLPWRLVLAAALGVIGWQISRYASRRVGSVVAAIATLLVFITPGSEIALWPFQVGQLFAIAAGLAVILLGDRPTRPRWVPAAEVVLLMFAVASSSAGIPLVGLVIVDRLLRPGRRRQILVAVPALLLYAWWNQKWGSLSPVVPASNLQSFAAAARQGLEVGIAAIQSLLGLGTHPISGGFLGMVGLLGLVAVVTWRLFGPVPGDRARILAIVAAIAAYWTLLAWGRSSVPGYLLSPRYLFFSQILLILLIVELLSPAPQEATASRGFRRGYRVVIAGLAVALLFGAAFNARSLRDASRSFRNEGDHQHAQVAALSVLTPQERTVAPFYRGARDMVLPAGGATYFKPPASRGLEPLSEAEVKALSPAMRGYVDRFLLGAISGEVPADQPRPAPVGAPATVTSTVPGAPIRPGSRSECVVVGAKNAPAAAYALGLRKGQSVLLENIGAAPMELRGKRYADAIANAYPIAVAPGVARTLGWTPDQGTAPWAFELRADRARICTTGG